MKVATIMGTRPEMIRLSQIIPKLDAWAQKHILIHTGQNIDPGLRDVFYEQLGIRQPDYFLEQTGCSLANQIGNIFGLVETMIHRETPDAVLVLGDTTSALSTLLCTRLGVTVYHMEAGNRCYDPSVPEELNRRVIDAVSSFNLPYTRTSKENLLREGISPQRIWECGNPIFEVLQRVFGDHLRIGQMNDAGNWLLQRPDNAFGQFQSGDAVPPHLRKSSYVSTLSHEPMK